MSHDDSLKKLAGESPIARFAEFIKESAGIKIAGSVSDLKDAQEEREAAIKKFEETKRVIAKALAALATDEAGNEHQKLLLIDSFSFGDKEKERPIPLLEHLLTNAIQEDKGEIVFRSVNALVRTEDIRGIDSSLVAEEETKKLDDALMAASNGKIPLFARAYDAGHYAITVGRIYS